MAKITRSSYIGNKGVTELKTQLLNYGIRIWDLSSNDTGLDILVTLPPKPIYLQSSQTNFCSLEDNYNRMFFGQVKATESESYFLRNKKAKYPFKITHLKGWKEAILPVIVFLVDLRDLNQPTIYWEQIKIDFKINENQKTQLIYLTKTLDRNCWYEFNKVIEDFNDKIIEKNILKKYPFLNHIIKEIEFHKQLRLLPEFTEFKTKKEEWLKLRNRKIFREFNPIKWEGKLDTEKPKVGIRTFVPKTEYAMFSSSLSTPYISSDVSTRIVREVFNTEEAKIFYDLLYTSKAEQIVIQGDFEQAESIFKNFQEPTLLFSDKNMTNKAFFNKYGKVFQSDFEGENIHYLKTTISIGNTKIKALSFNNYRWDKIDPQLSLLKAIILDKAKVKYRVKRDLEVEWRTPLERTIVTENDKEEKDPHFFEFTCFTVAEIKYTGKLLVWFFSENEEEKLRNLVIQHLSKE